MIPGTAPVFQAERAFTTRYAFLFHELGPSVQRLQNCGGLQRNDGDRIFMVDQKYLEVAVMNEKKLVVFSICDIERCALVLSL
jgi:hypothetical protein